LIWTRVYRTSAARPTAAIRPAIVCLAALAPAPEALLEEPAPVAVDPAAVVAPVPDAARVVAPVAVPPTTPPMPKRVVEPIVEVKVEPPEVMTVTMAEVVTAEEDAYFRVSQIQNPSVTNHLLRQQRKRNVHRQHLQCRRGW
jgi:hypothetical protein